MEWFVPPSGEVPSLPPNFLRADEPKAVPSLPPNFFSPSEQSKIVAPSCESKVIPSHIEKKTSDKLLEIFCSMCEEEKVENFTLLPSNFQILASKNFICSDNEKTIKALRILRESPSTKFTPPQIIEISRLGNTRRSYAYSTTGDEKHLFVFYFYSKDSQIHICVENLDAEDKSHFVKFMERRGRILRGSWVEREDIKIFDEKYSL